MTSTLRVGTRQGYVRRHGTTAFPRVPLTKLSLKETTSRGTARILRWHPCETRLHVSTLEPPPATEHVMWFDRFPEFWKTAQSAEDLQHILHNETERMIFVDFYAGHCGACRAAFPQLSRVAGNPEFQEQYLFVKACVTDDGIRDFAREQGVTGIPTATVYASGGKKLISFGASFRKINAVKANLLVIADNRGEEFFVDPNGHVMPRLDEDMYDK